MRVSRRRPCATCKRRKKTRDDHELWDFERSRRAFNEYKYSNEWEVSRRGGVPAESVGTSYSYISSRLEHTRGELIRSFLSPFEPRISVLLFSLAPLRFARTFFRFRTRFPSSPRLPRSLSFLHFHLLYVSDRAPFVYEENGEFYEEFGEKDGNRQRDELKRIVLTFLLQTRFNESKDRQEFL